MFYGSKFNNDISKWNTSNVIYMAAMFRRSVFNQDISNWNFTKIKNTYLLFDQSPLEEKYGIHGEKLISK